MTSMSPGVPRRHHRLRLRFTVSLAAGLVVGLPVSVATASILGLLVGWETAAVVYMIWAWTVMLPLDARATSDLAGREDPGRTAMDVILLAASVTSLAPVAIVIAAGTPHGAVDAKTAAAVAVTSIVLSWALVHTVFTARYARLYYANPVGGISFNADDPPCYGDFAYLAFTIGMTYQVSDTNLQNRTIRRTALRHGLLSYLFGAVIIAATINLLSGLAK
jgi:uncharacterized membrane protein